MIANTPPLPFHKLSIILMFTQQITIYKHFQYMHTVIVYPSQRCMGLVISCYTVNGLKPNIYVGGCSIYKVNICTISIAYRFALVFLVLYAVATF